MSSGAPDPQFDVVVLGAGPAGAAAAIEAARMGLSVAVIDEAHDAGGQVYRVAPGVRAHDSSPERIAGDTLRDALAAAKVDRRFAHRVWHVERNADVFCVHAVGDAGPVTLTGRALIVASGALERHIPIAGWDRPGVIGLAGATVLLKAQRMLPGRKVVVAGAGPLLLAVAAGIVHGGGRVAAVVDIHPRSRWLQDWRSLASRPDLSARGARWLATLIAHRTPMLHGTVLRRIEGDPAVKRVVVSALDAKGGVSRDGAERVVACDAVCVGFGLQPATDITRLLGATHAFTPERGGWHVVTDDDQATSVAGVFACGDTAGIAGAAAAPWSGRIAAVSAARHLRRISDSDASVSTAPMRQARDRAAQFGMAMTRLADAGDGMIAAIAPDLPVCLCEQVSRAALDAAIDAGAPHDERGEVGDALRDGSVRWAPVRRRRSPPHRTAHRGFAPCCRRGHRATAAAACGSGCSGQHIRLRCIADRAIGAAMTRCDLAIIGGGIMGVTAALRAAAGGMNVVVLERGGVGAEATGVNAGTLSLQIKRVALMPYALRGHDWWKRAGEAVGFHQTGGYTLAFNAREHALLEERMRLKIAAGAPITFVSPTQVREAEPALGDRIVAATHCAEDGYADSTRSGVYLRQLLRDAAIAVREHAPVDHIESGDGGFVVRTAQSTIQAKRILLACGAWTRSVAAMLGVHLPIEVRVNTVTATERGPILLRSAIGHATGLLTLKQKANGSFLIGGGWQGRGTPETGRGEVVAETMLQNLRLARFAVPALAGIRAVRSWTGFEAYVPDYYPLAGALPGVAGAFVLACVRGGYTIGPCIGPLVADLILGRTPELPLFDPARVLEPTTIAASA